MKKVILVIGIALAGFSVNAQNFNVGLSGALPVGDSSDFYSFGLILDANYLYEVSEEFSVGASTGLIYSFGDTLEETVTIPGVGTQTFESEAEDATFIPIAAAARYFISEEFVVGADIGYAIGIEPDANDGGFYYAPKVQYYFTEMISAVAAYRGISVDEGPGGSSSFDHITLGVEFKF